MSEYTPLPVADFFAYQTFPKRPALLIGLGILSVAVIWPAEDMPLVRMIWFATAAGPLLWAGMQFLRGGRGISLLDNHMRIKRSISGRSRKLRYETIRGCALTARGGLVIIYQEPSTDPELPPKRGLILTAYLENAAGAFALLTDKLRAAPNPDPLSVDDIARLIARRRLRDGLIGMLILLSTPLWVLILARIWAGLRA